MSYLAARDYGLDSDTFSDSEPLTDALRRRIDGRYPVDEFGLDPQLCDLLSPLFSSVVRVHLTGGEHVPSTGPAVLVANRGFGVVVPAVLGVAVRRATKRRLRVVGVPGVPLLDGVARRLGVISASAADVRTCLVAGHLVAVPLAPTWMRTGAGVPPRPLMQALTHAPIIPVAVTPGGPFRTAVRPWRVRFGSLVTLPHPYDPDDPLVAARFGEAMKESVGELLNEV